MEVGDDLHPLTSAATRDSIIFLFFGPSSSATRKKPPFSFESPSGKNVFEFYGAYRDSISQMSLLFPLCFSLSLSLFFLARTLERKKEEEKKIGTVLQKRFIKSIAMELHFMNPPPIERDSLCYNRSVLILRSLGIVRVFVLSTRFFFFIKKFLLMQGVGGKFPRAKGIYQGPDKPLFNSRPSQRS